MEMNRNFAKVDIKYIDRPINSPILVLNHLSCKVHFFTPKCSLLQRSVALIPLQIAPAPVSCNKNRVAQVTAQQSIAKFKDGLMRTSGHRNDQ